MSEYGILTVSAAMALGELLSAAQRGALVARVVDYGDGVVYGTARSVGDERGMFVGPNDDARDCYLRVTTSGGFEAFWPVVELVGEYRLGLFVLDYQP